MAENKSRNVVNYNKLVDAFKISSPESSHAVAQKKAKVYFDKVKDKPDVEELVNEKVSEWKRSGLKRKINNNSFFTSWSKKTASAESTASTSKPSTTESTPDVAAEPDVQILSSQSGKVNVAVAELSPPTSEQTTSGATAQPPVPKKTCHAENILDKSIVNLNTDIDKLQHVLRMGVIADPEETKKALQTKMTELKEATKKKNNLIRNRKNKKASRDKKKEQSKELSLAKTGTYEAPVIGRPMSVDDSALISAITKIALAGSAADDRRRTEMINTCKTLDDLVEQLKGLGYNLKRSSIYLRLLPRRQDSIEGKRHKNVANVKLRKAQNNKRSKNPDRWFAATTAQMTEDLAVLMGKDNVAILGKDDKSHIPMGIPAANKQSPILMTMEYPVTLPDHTFVVASKHKLIPSVYASREINKDGLSYSGPTHASIRSLKHDKADAFSCMEDLDHILNLEEFEPFLKHQDKVKPIWIFTRDGHDGPRFPTTRQTLIKFFQDHNLDLLVAVCNAAGLSAYHFIERRMAPLSKQLAGIVLPHDSFGTHLDANGVTVDPKKEMENFKKAGETLAGIWSDSTIDNYPVSAHWVDSSDDSKKYKNHSDAKIGANWLHNHVYISKYCLQIAKCGNIDCCEPLRTTVQEVLGGKFLPPPLALESGASLIDPRKKSEKDKLCGFYKSLALKHMRPKKYKLCGQLPFDLYCPSVKIDDPDLFCPHCKKICTTKALLKFHLRATQHHSFELNPDSDDEESNNITDVDTLPVVEDGACLIPSMDKFLESPWDITYE